MSGSRAPIISTILVYLIMIFFFRKGLRLGYQLKSIVINALLFVLLVFFFRSNELAQSMLDASVNRMMVLYSDIGGNNSAQARVGHIYNSIDHISEKPFMGYGFGSYGVVSTGLDIRSYPHNSILEVWFELGLFGLISFLSIILFHTIWNFWKISAGAGMVTVYMFLNSLSSSSFSELKIEFGLFSVFLLMSKSKSNVN